LGSCCTKGDTAKCVQELSPAFTDIDRAEKPGANVNALAAKAVGVMLQAVRERVKPEQVKDANAKKLMSLCPNGSCSTQEVFEEMGEDSDQDSEPRD